MKNAKGITLVALVISIIVLLILATISINLVINNGILDKAKYAVDKYSEEEELEQIKLAVLSAQMIGNGNITTENLNKELQANFNDNTTTAKKIGDNWYYNGYCIDKNGNVEKYDKLLPKEYQQVEYLESTGAQYIDTEYIANQDTGFYIKYIIENQIAANSSITGYLIGCRTKQNNIQIKRYQLSTWKDYNGGMLAFDINNNMNNTYDPKIIPGEIQEILLKNKKLKCADGTIKEIGNHNFTCDGSLFLLCCKEINESTGNIVVQEFAKAKLYKVELYNYEQKNRDFIPCYCRSDNKPGLYDTVEGKFYTNQGTGDDFIAGPDV